MSGLRSFVSEDEIEEQKKRRQEEWERVRTADQPKEAPDPDYDPRSLYERLREQREKKQQELDETQKLRHMVRGLDSEEIGFLDFVDNMKAAEETKRRLEEKKLIEEIHKTVEQEMLQEPTTSSAASTAPKPPTKPKMPSKQALIIGSSIKRRSSEKVESNVDQPPDKRLKLTESDDVDTVGKPPENVQNSNGRASITKTTQIVGVRPSSMRPVGVLLPGFGGYSPDSDSSSGTDSSGSDNNDVLYTNPIQQLITDVAKPASSSSTSADSADKLKRSVSGGSASSQPT